MSNWDTLIRSVLDDMDEFETVIAESKLEKQRLDLTIKTNTNAIAELRESLMNMMLENGVVSENHELASIIIKSGPIKVVRDPNADPEDLPIDLVRIKREPDMAEIKKALIRGDNVPGYSLETGPDQLQIKRKTK